MWDFKKNIYKSRREDISPCPDCVDHDVVIGDQTWTGCNATVEYYNNGDPIPYVDDETTWAGLTTGAWCWYNNDSANESIYGKLYNWYAVNDPRGVAPTGYHVPTETEVITLFNYLGSATIAGGKLKEVGLCHWSAPNTGATDISGFTGLPGGARINDGAFNYINTYGEWWTSTEVDSSTSKHFYLINFSAAASIANYFKNGGFSLRFIKDEVTCPDVTIGTQTWTSCNLNVDIYRNGDPIPEVSDPVAWAALTTGAWCWHSNDSANGPIYGKLYNWYAVNDPRGLAPVGYHIPTNAEWTTLSNYLGGLSTFGAAIKETGTTHWRTPNTGATNSSGFTALGASWRDINGTFATLTNEGYWWSSTAFSVGNSYSRYVNFNTTTGFNVQNNVKDGLSVRLIKD